MGKRSKLALVAAGASLAALPAAGLLTGGGRLAQASLPLDLEPAHADAVLSYQRGDFRGALRDLEPLLARLPDERQLLELKALNLKLAGDERGAAAGYRRLMHLCQKPACDPAPYAFELGVLQFRAKDFPDSQVLFRASLDAGFNPGPSRYFLGMVAYEQRKWDLSARWLVAANRPEAGPYRAPALYYLGQSRAQLGETRQASRDWAEARDLARGNGAANASIAQASQQALDGAERARWFGGARVLGGYDSNVLLVPDGASAAAGASGVASAMGVVQADLGYSSSGAARAQAAPTVSFSANRELNSQVAAGQFISASAGLPILFNPLGRFGYGLRAGASYVLNSTANATDGTTSWQKFLASGSIGPLARYETDSAAYSLDLSYETQRFFQDPDTAQYRRSGGVSSARLAYRGTRRSTWLNPDASASIAYAATSGEEFRAVTPAIAFGNTWRIGATFELPVRVDLAFPRYGARPLGARADTQISFSLGARKGLSRVLGLSAQWVYVVNRSNVAELYQYSRSAILAGVDCRF